jgi:hypothetical protein
MNELFVLKCLGYIALVLVFWLGPRWRWVVAEKVRPARASVGNQSLLVRESEVKDVTKIVFEVGLDLRSFRFWSRPSQEEVISIPDIAQPAILRIAGIDTGEVSALEVQCVNALPCPLFPGHMYFMAQVSVGWVFSVSRPPTVAGDEDSLNIPVQFVKVDILQFPEIIGASQRPRRVREAQSPSRWLRPVCPR